MSHIQKQRSVLRRMAPALAAAVALAACDLLSADNPTLVTPEDVEGKEEMLQPLVNGIESRFRQSYAWMASSGSAASDESVFGHVWTPWNEYDRRRVTAQGGANGIGYPFVTATIATGEIYTDEIERLVGAQASSSPALAGALAYTGFGYILGAEHHCEMVVDGTRGPVARAYEKAITHLTRAAAIGAAGGAQGRHWQNLANVGIARSHLNLGNLAQAIQFANQVDAGFEAWVRYSAHTDFFNWTYYNLYARTAGFKSPVEFNQGIGPSQAARLLNRTVPGSPGTFTWDRRVPFQADSLTLLMGGWATPRYAYVPYSPSSFSGYSADAPHTIRDDEDIRFASSLEAKYIIAEASLRGGAGGWSNAQVLAFIDQRRAAGGHGPYGGADLFAELREQKKLDFYFAGYRFPDLRRYLTKYGINEFPSGGLDGFTSASPEDYGADTCWPLPPTEI
jgi:hypothetical protein